MRIEEKPRRSQGDDNIVPMINIVFLLLIFFLLAGTLSPRPPFELESVTTTLRPQGDAPVNGLYVSANGTLYFGGKVIDISALPSIPNGARVGDKKNAIDIIVDRRLSGGALFPIMEALSKAGFTKVRLVTEKAIAN